MNNNHILTETDIDNIDNKSPLEHQIQQQEVKVSRWRFDKINSITIYFYQTDIMKGSIYVRTPLRSNAIMNNETNDKYYFIWSIIAKLYPCNENHYNRVSFYRKQFNEMQIEEFGFTNGFKCSEVHRFEKLNNLSINIFELTFYRDQNKWKHKLIPIKFRLVKMMNQIVL